MDDNAKYIATVHWIAPSGCVIKPQEFRVVKVQSFSDGSTFILENNELVYIDLEPLMGCTNLTHLDLSANSLTSIDLGPLSFCANLEDIYLDSNNFEYVDISPLRTCKNLREIGLEKKLIAWNDSIINEKELPEQLRRRYLKDIRNAQDTFIRKQKIK